MKAPPTVVVVGFWLVYALLALGYPSPLERAASISIPAELTGK